MCTAAVSDSKPIALAVSREERNSNEGYPEESVAEFIRHSAPNLQSASGVGRTDLFPDPLFVGPASNA